MTLPRTLRYGLLFAVSLSGVLLFLLASASGNTAFFERNYPLLLAVNGVIAGLLFILVLLLVRRLVKRLRQGRFGARMMIRFSIAFALMGVLPGVLIYIVSTQFLSRSIESWFDVRVDRALDSGLTLGRAVLAISMRFEATRRERVVDRPRVSARHRADAPGVEASQSEARLELGRAGWPLGEYVDHSSGGIAVEHREGSAQDLDAPGGPEVDVRDLRLPVRQRRRDAVDDHPQPAHAEGRAGAEAADRDLQVLRVVLPVVGHDTGQCGQGFGEVHLQLAVAEALQGHRIQRCRDVERVACGAGRGHHHDFRRWRRC